MKKFKFASAALLMLAFVGMMSCSKPDDPVTPEPTPQPVFPKGDFELVEELTNLDEIGSTPFVIVNVEEMKAFFGPAAQNLAFEAIDQALLKSNANIAFKLEPLDGNYLLRAITPTGEEYNIWGSPGYLNAQPLESGWCCFILGLNNQ